MTRQDITNVLRLAGVQRDMIFRCTSTKSKKYRHYGGRGIKVCREWMAPTTFIEWALSNGYREGLQLDRIDVNGNYEPSNCRFVTVRTNVSNRRCRSKYGTGVERVGRKFRSRMFIDGKKEELGRFDTPEEAAQAYRDKLHEIQDP